MRIFKNTYCILIILLFSILTHFSFAGTKGKIVGTVLDKETGKPMPGVNVVLQGTILGAVTDQDGYYYIINIPSGTYSLKFTFIGYKPVIVNKVEVIQDLTNEINVEMETTVLEGEAVEVVAERPLLHKQDHSSTQTISSDEFKNIIVESVSGVINKSAGVASGGYIRGSRWTEVNYMVDGLSLTNPITGGMITDINKNAVEEIVLQTGGFSAEYGNAMGGVVNVVTKEGGSEYSGSLRYKTDKINSGSQFYKNANIWDFTFGGPLIKGSRFFITGYLNTRDMNPQRKVIAPDGTNIGRHPHQGFQEYRTNAKFSIPITEAMKLKITGSMNRSQGLNYNFFWRFGSNENQLDRLGAWLNKSQYAAIIIDHAIAEKMYYTFKVGIMDWHSINGQRDRSEWSNNEVGANCDWWDDFTFRKPFLDHSYQLPGDTVNYSKWRLRDSQGVDDVYSRRSSDSVSVNNPYGITGGIQNTVDADYFNQFIWFGDRDWYSEDRDRNFIVKYDLTSQFHKNHEVKAGFEFNKHNVNRFRIGGMSALNGVGITYPIIDFYEESPSDTALTVESAENLGEGYQPLEFAAYVNYQLQLKGMYLNLGLRFDYFNAVTEYRINPIQTDEPNPFKQDRTEPDPKYQLSPRLGISFPVTDRTKFRFNYGYFFQRPPMERMFAYLWFDRNQADVNMGNPDIEPQKTIAYEVGLSTILSQDVALDLTLYQKNMFHLEGYRIRRAPTLDWFFQAYNEEYAESKGFELTLRKRYSHYLGGSISYSFCRAEGTSSNVTQISRYPLTSVTYAKQLGYEPIYPQDTMPMNFDQRHTIYINANVQIPFNEGPTIFNKKLLSGFGANLMSTIHSGRPYTPITEYAVDLTTDRFNSRRYPWTFTADGKLYKDFKVLGHEWTLFVEVYNIFNLQKPYSVYEGSDDPDNPMYDLTLGSLSNDSYVKGQSGLYSEWSDFNEDGISDPEERLRAYQIFEEDMLSFKENYPTPRTFMVGLDIKL